MKSLVYLFALSALTLACGPKADFRDGSITPAPAGARVKIYHVAPDAPGVVVYLNDKVFTGVNTVPTTPASLPAALTYSNVFPAQDYAILPAGATTADKPKMSINAAATATTAEMPLITGTPSITGNASYSLFIAGAAPAFEALILTDRLTATDAGKAYVRVINLVPNSPVGGYDVTLNGALLANLPAYRAFTDFIPVTPVPLNTTAQAVTAKNGTTTLTLTNGLQPNAGRFYTLIIRGLASNTRTPVTLSSSVNL